MPTRVTAKIRRQITEAMQPDEGFVRLQEAGRQMQGCADPLDLMAASSDFQIVAEITTIRSQNVKSAEQAAQRLNEGAYGKCDDCGEEISQKRLKAIPFATRCVICQTQVEMRK